MAEPVRRVKSGDKHFDFSGLMAHEMIQVMKWTGIEKRSEFHKAMLDEKPDAILAAFTLVAWREQGSTTEADPPRWGTVAVDLDDLRWSLVVGDRQVKILFETDANGDPVVAVADDQGRPVPGSRKGTWAKPTGAEGEKTTLVPLEHEDGSLRYAYLDTGEDVDPTQTTPGSIGSSPTAKPSGNASESPSQPRPEEAA